MQNPNAYTLRGLSQHRPILSGFSFFILVGLLMVLFYTDSQGDIGFLITLVTNLWLPVLVGVVLHMNYISNYIFGKNYQFLLYENFIEITINHHKKVMIPVIDIDKVSFTIPANQAGSLLKIYHKSEIFYLYAGLFGTQLKHGRTMHSFLNDELLPYLQYHNFTENCKKEQLVKSYTFIKPSN